MNFVIPPGRRSRETSLLLDATGRGAPPPPPPRFFGGTMMTVRGAAPLLIVLVSTIAVAAGMLGFKSNGTTVAANHGYGLVISPPSAENIPSSPRYAIEGMYADDEIQAATGGPTATFRRFISEEREALTQTARQTGVDPLVYAEEDTPTGAFSVIVQTSHGIDELLPSHFTADNHSIENIQERTDTWFTFDVIPDEGATAVTVLVEEDALTSQGVDGIGNQRWEHTWDLALDEAPKILGAQFISDNARLISQGPYTTGEHVDIVVLFSEQVNVAYTETDGPPSIAFEIDKSNSTYSGDAAYHSGDGTEKLVFRHELTEGIGTAWSRITSQTITLPANASIKNLAATQDASVVIPPRVVAATATRSGRPSNVQSDHYVWAGLTVDLQLTYNVPVNVSGSPGVAITGKKLGDTDPATNNIDVRASYTSGTGTTTLNFHYVVPDTHDFNPENPLVVKSYLVYPDGARITDASEPNSDVSPYIRTRPVTQTTVLEADPFIIAPPWAPLLQLATSS